MRARSHHSLKNNLVGKLRMPAEWEPHAATWIAWPHNCDDWPGKFEPIPWVYAEIIRNLSRHEPVEIIVNDAAGERGARKVLQRADALGERIRFHRWRTDRVWTRDSGCTFVKHESNQAEPDSPLHTTQGTLGRLSPPGLGAIKWRFNAWAKYSDWKKDEKIGSLMAKAAGAHEILAQSDNKPVVLEGGAIDINGHGTLLATEECLLSKVQQRNPQMKRSDYEKLFAAYLGVSNVIWLKSGIAGDDTHGHVDDITRFVTPDTVVSVIESNPNDVNYEPLRENIRRLRAATDQDGKELA
ncbi:MAG: agmatine deiminase family protein, partial [Terriglobales bacterium]